jgi:hypothetical protein
VLWVRVCCVFVVAGCGLCVCVGGAGARGALVGACRLPGGGGARRQHRRPPQHGRPPPDSMGARRACARAHLWRRVVGAAAAGLEEVPVAHHV